MPFYFQLKQILSEQIAQLQPGDRLPGDFELCSEYDVSRTVVRQALSQLEVEGLVERVKGRGTFVAAPRTGSSLIKGLTGLFEDVSANGGTLRSEVRRLELEPADDQVATALGLTPGEPVLVIERLRHVDDEPWVYAITHLPPDIAPGLRAEDLVDQSLYALLEDRYGVRLARGRRSVEAASAGVQLAKDLHIRRGAPLLVLRSTSYGENDRPVEHFTAFHRGDRSRFEVDLERDHRAPAGAVPPSMIVVR